MNKKLKIQPIIYGVFKTFDGKIVSKYIKYAVYLSKFFGLNKKYLKISNPSEAVNSNSKVYVNLTKCEIFATEMNKDLAEKLIEDIYNNPDKYIVCYGE